ncbi:MAG: Na+:H+ antiporter, NhaA family [Acidobacteriota bacterium]|nr:Na+:H+ antiporter, NhaA family [Acidobacteriota bacterium]
MSKKQPDRKVAAGKQAQKKKPARRSNLPFIIIGVVLLVVVAAGAWYLMKSKQPGEIATGKPGASPAHVAGSESAPVVLEEFGDFQCPPCGQMFPDVEKIRQDYGGRLRFIFREYPLIRVHPHALLAAHAAEAAGLQGKFWEMQRALFENQRAWSTTQDPTAFFESYARQAGLDADRYRRDMGGGETDARVIADRERAESIGVESTPTFFINGRKVPPPQTNPKGLREEIDRVLNK